MSIPHPTSSVLSSKKECPTNLLLIQEYSIFMQRTDFVYVVYEMPRPGHFIKFID